MTLSEIAVPAFLRDLRYCGANYPGSSFGDDLSRGANCQVFAYAFLRAHGRVLPPFRSSELWEDETWSRAVEVPLPLDLVLLHDQPRAFGAHVGVCVSGRRVAHLSRAQGQPRVEALSALRERPEYRYLVGFKRVDPTPGAGPEPP